MEFDYSSRHKICHMTPAIRVPYRARNPWVLITAAAACARYTYIVIRDRVVSRVPK